MLGIVACSHMGVGFFPGVDFFPVARRGGTIFGSRGGLNSCPRGGGSGLDIFHMFFFALSGLKFALFAQNKLFV